MSGLAWDDLGAGKYLVLMDRILTRSTWPEWSHAQIGRAPDDTGACSRRNQRKTQQSAKSVVGKLAGIATTISAPVVLVLQVLRFVLDLIDLFNEPPMG